MAENKYKIIICGGAGYIGSHMVKIAHNAGYEVLTVDNLSTGHRDAVKYGKFEECDLHDTDKLRKVFDEFRPNLVMHFSAFSLVGESVEDPHKYYYNNVSGTLNLLKVMKEFDCTKFIFSSTAAVFGNPKYTPIDEKHVKNPINPYGESKLMVEKILIDFNKSYGLNYVIFRYFNAAGHDPDGELSERHNPETHLLPIIMQVVKKERDFITIFGEDYDTPDGTCIRDYIHINDICNAHLKGAELLISSEETISEDFNLGNGDGFSVREVINSVKEITSTDFEVRIGPKREGDPSILVADNRKAKRKLNWQPEYQTINSVIKTL